MKSGTVHDQAVAGAAARAFPARSVMVGLTVRENVPGSAKEVRSLIARVAIVASALSVTVVATAVPPTVRTKDDDVTEVFATASEKVTVIGARRTTSVAPAIGVVRTTVGDLWSTFMVVGAEEMMSP